MSLKTPSVLLQESLGALPNVKVPTANLCRPKHHSSMEVADVFPRECGTAACHECKIIFVVAIEWKPVGRDWVLLVIKSFVRICVGMGVASYCKVCPNGQQLGHVQVFDFS